MIRRIAVLGAGTMGHGIAHAAIAAGYDTRTVRRVATARSTRGARAIEAIVAQGRRAGKGRPADADAMLARRLTTTTSLAEALDGTPTSSSRRRPSGSTSSSRCSPRSSGSRRPAPSSPSNTSALSITELAGSTRAPGARGRHALLQSRAQDEAVEIVRALESAPATLAAIEEVSRRMGKETVLVRESPGFITTRVNASIGNEAFYMLMEGVASARDIDKALKLGLNHPMGPFELVDLVGLDTRLSILEYLHRSLGEKYRPCPLLAQYVKAGRLGRKVGRGVYDY